MSAVLNEPSPPLVPPHSIDAEQSVLGGVMLVPEALAEIADWLTPDDFYRREHRMIFRAIGELARAGQPFDPVTLGDWFDRNGETASIGGPAYLTELAANTPSAANVVAYGEIVLEKSRLRSLIETGTRITGAAFAGKTDAQSVIANAVHTLSKMQISRLHIGLEPVNAGLRELFASMTDRWQEGPKLLGLPTPWREVNERLGGLRDGELYIVGARPSMGKSVFGGQIAVMNGLRGTRTAWFSLEMTNKQCLARAVACLADVEYRWVQQPDAKDPDANLKWDRIARANESLLASKLLIDDTPALAIEQVMARARRAHMRAPIRLLVLDHMHDMKIDPKQARFDYGAIAQGGKTLAKEFDCPVLILAQLNRQVTNRADKRPELADLRESGEIEQKADVVLFLHREDYYDPNQKPGAVDVIVAKGRDLECGNPLHLRHRFDRMRLEDWEGPPPARIEPESARFRAASRWRPITGEPV